MDKVFKINLIVAYSLIYFLIQNQLKGLACPQEQLLSCPFKSSMTFSSMEHKRRNNTIFHAVTMKNKVKPIERASS